MEEAIKEIGEAIRETKPTVMHPDLYNDVMDSVGFSEEDLIVVLSHPIDNKALGVNFVSMTEQHMTLCLMTFFGKYYTD